MMEEEKEFGPRTFRKLILSNNAKVKPLQHSSLTF